MRKDILSQSRRSTLIVVIASCFFLFLLSSSGVQALSSPPRTVAVQPQQMNWKASRRTVSSSSSSSLSTKLHMSDVPQQQRDDGKRSKEPRIPPPLVDWKPPPQPEDIFVMMGDVLSLCIYGISDHFFCQVVSKMQLIQQTEAAAGGSSSLLLKAPVWLDLNAQYANHVLVESNLNRHFITHYSPLLEPMGTAICLLVGSWLIAGWFHRAFSFRNTLDCTTERALLVTARTWMTSCALLFSIVLASQAFCGCDRFYLVQRGDLDYIVDSASVLVLWRFLASFLLGSGRDR